MSSLLSILIQAGELLIVVLGFSLIIVIHELGHFIAARWAGIRVLAFAVGFGPALVSYRKGLGWRRGSSEAELKKAIAVLPADEGLGAERDDELRGGAGTTRDTGSRQHPTISSTEYRLNSLPFGGYVKMLGQDDANPTARSTEPDSYQTCKPWKRMIVISAGVVANLITAAMLFVAVFMLGLPTEPAKIGPVSPNSPAATAVASNAALLGVDKPGLRPGDVVVAIDGVRPLSFNDLVLETAMNRRGTPLHIDIQRAGLGAPLHFAITPEEEPLSRFQTIGAGPAASRVLADPADPAVREQFKQRLADMGLGALEPGMELVSVGGQPAVTPYDINRAIDAAAGQPVAAVFRTPTAAGQTGATGREVTVQIGAPAPADRHLCAWRGFAARSGRARARTDAGAARQGRARRQRRKQSGTAAGRCVCAARRRGVAHAPAGVREIKSHKGRTIQVTIARKTDSGLWVEHNLGEVPVNRKGQIGFDPGDTAETESFVGYITTAAATASTTLPKLPPGSRILAANDIPTPTLAALRAALATLAAGTPKPTVQIKYELPIHTRGQQPLIETVAWTLSEVDAASLLVTPWEPALATDSFYFQPEEFNLIAAGPLDAIRMGVRETRRVMATTYLTFARLFQGTVKVEHLKGPVGIAHIGTMLADRGAVWLLFFMALISVNLAVINFLPIPIADGGHFVFLLYEQITGKPVSVAVQNVAAIAGLIVLAAVFLIVTYHDIVNLF